MENIFEHADTFVLLSYSKAILVLQIILSGNAI